MKNTLFLFMFFTGNFFLAQQSENRFSQSEQNTNNYDQTLPAAEPEEGGPSNPPGGEDDPVPIDDYIPVLVMTALGIILYTTTRKKRKWS